MTTIEQAAPVSGGRLIHELLQDALGSVRRHLGLEIAFISEFSAGRRFFRYVDAASADCPVRVGDSDPLEQSYCQRIVDGRLPGLMNDARQNAEALTLPVTTQLPVGAHLSVPILLGQELFGTFCCFSRESDASLDERHLSMMRLYADFVGRLLERTVNDQRQALERQEQVRRVIDEGLFHVVYQPIVRIDSREVVGHEALTRFTAEPRRTPDQWFAQAALAGMTVDLEGAVVRKALEDFHRLPPQTYLSLNVSPQAIVEGSVLGALQANPPSRLVLEVTEHASIDDYQALDSQLAPLRAQGLQLAVDDAGAGYASFRHILKLKPDIIKLDGSLVGAIDKDPGIRALAAALARFARETGAAVLAECVETEQELQALRDLQVDKAQGYLLGRPAPLPN